MADENDINTDPWQKARLTLQQQGHDPLTPRGLFKATYDELLLAWTAVVADINDQGANSAFDRARLRGDRIVHEPAAFLDARSVLEYGFPQAIRLGLLRAMLAERRTLPHPTESFPYEDPKKWDSGNWVRENLRPVRDSAPAPWEQELSEAEDDDLGEHQNSGVFPWPETTPAVKHRAAALARLFAPEMFDQTAAAAHLDASYELLDEFVWEFLQWGEDVYALHYGAAGQGARDLFTGRVLCKRLNLVDQFSIFERALAGDFSDPPEHWETAYLVARNMISDGEPRIARQVVSHLSEDGTQGRARRIIQVRAAVKLNDYSLAERVFRGTTESEVTLEAADEALGAALAQSIADSQALKDFSTADGAEESLFGNVVEWIRSDEQSLRDYMDGSRDTYKLLDKPLPLGMADFQERLDASARNDQRLFVLTTAVGQMVQDGLIRNEIAHDKTHELVAEVGQSLQKVLANQGAYEQAIALLAVELSGLRTSLSEREWQRTATHFWELWQERASDSEKGGLETRAQLRFGEAVWNKLAEESKRDLTAFLLIEDGIDDSVRFRAFALLVTFERELRKALLRGGVPIEGSQGLGKLVVAAREAGGRLPDAIKRISDRRLLELRNALAHGDDFEKSEYQRTEVALLYAGPNGGRSVLSLVVLHSR